MAVAADPLGRPGLQAPRVAKVKAMTAPSARAARERVDKAKATNKAQSDRARQERDVSWPKASKISQALTGKAAAGAVARVAPTKLGKSSRTAKPTATGTATVHVLSQEAARKAGITGVLLTATASQPGSAHISVDYSSFASAVGGNWSTRLGLVSYPACILTTPTKAGCHTATPLKSSNDQTAQTVSAPVTLAAQTTPASGLTVLALAATTTTSGKGAGDFKATPLSASSTWEAGGSSGSFTWSHPLTVPPAVAGPVPSLGLSYDSGSIDGRTANTNNQGSLLGEGFDVTSSYIERKYGSCDKDGQSGKFDLCWKYENASVVLNGKSSELVKDDTTGVWHLKNDDASKVTLSTGATNGDEDGEFWKIVTADGTTYTFGLDKLPGAGTERTNSVWTAPVYGDDAGEPGYTKGSTFASRAAVQAWRWNLDLVEDVHGNASTHWYKAESNYYAKNGDKSALASYHRGGYEDEIRYGQRKDTLFTGTPSGKVSFSYAERCTATDCSSLTAATADNWPDVPFDAICTQSATDCAATSPAFFTRKRLTGVNTFVWSTAAEPDAYAPVDSYAFTQEFLDGGDIGNSSDQTLTLKSLIHTGKNGTDKALPPVDFTYHMLSNRVGLPGEDILPLHRPRLNTVTSEAGAVTTVTLSAPQCVRGSKMPTAEDNNSLSCYPVYWAPNGGETTLDWFHKYNVLAVTTSDPVGFTDTVENSYTYENPGWHYNDDPMTPNDERTWSVWRGYQKVTTYTGASDDTQSKTVKLFMQGLHGDKLKDGTTRTAVVAGIDLPGLNITDANDTDVFAGQLREQIVYNGSAAVSVTVHNIWNKQTASQQKSYANVKAHFVKPSRTYAYTYLTASDTWRSAYTSYTYDSYGMTSLVDAVGDSAKTGDETCTRTWYARNDTKGMTSLVSRTRTVASTCVDAAGAAITDDKLTLPASTATRGSVLSDTAVVYDDTTATGWSATQTPTLGEATWTGRAKTYPAANGTADRNPAVNGGWQTISTTTYDTTTSKLGRPLSVKDAYQNITTTAYTPAASGPLTATIVTSPKLASNGQTHKAYTYLDPARGSVIRTFDANLKQTNNTYDALGRLTATWLPNRSQAGNDSPNAKYDYNLSRTSQPWTSVSTLNADGTTYQTSYDIADSLLRPLQTQTPSPKGGRILTDTRYDSRGLAYESYADVYDDKSAPNGTYTRAEYGGAPTQTQTVFDGAGRPTTAELLVLGVHKWSTTTSYTGDSTATTAVTGGSATRTLTDALGRTTETRTYASTQPDDPAYGATLGATYTRVSTQYTPDGKPSLVTGPDNAQWSYTYDLFGRTVTANDPDSGTTTTHYTDLDQVDTTQDANKTTLLYQYDELGRKTGLWQTSRTDPNKLAAWTYDSILKGLPDTSVRYEGGLSPTGKAYTKKVTAYDSMSRATSTDLLLPSNDALVTSGAVAATTTIGTAYRIDGTVNNIKQPAAGGLPAETVEPDYNALGMPIGLSGASSYLLGVSYSALGQPEQLTLGVSPSAKKATIANIFEPGTGRLQRSHVTDQTHTWMPQDLNYNYDEAGNVTSIQDPSTLGGTSKPDYQCFTYDGQRRLSEAWTPKSADCATNGRTTANLDGPAPFWTSYTFTNSGQRKTETQHTGTPTTTNYCYQADRPHALSATTTAPDCTLTAPQYKYDDNGNTTTRVEKAGSTTSQSLLWSPEGKLSKLTKGTSATEYIYDADGNQLIRRDSSGETVLYLGDTEVHTKAGKTWASRYYSVAGSTIAVRTNEAGTEKLSFLAADQHSTSSLSLDSTTQAISKRYTTPFGAPRGTSTGTWPDDKAFLGKPADTATGLTHIGAREYDPTTGQFISVDPLLELDKHQTLNGYSYAGQAPTTNSDPTGTCLDPGNGHCQPGNNSGIPDPGYPINTNPAPAPPPKPSGSGTAPTSSSGNTGSGSNGNANRGGNGCGDNGFTDICYGFGEIFYGLVSNIPHTASYGGWLVDSDCWTGGGAGAPGCDYGASFDEWAASQGYDTSSDAYQVPSFVAALFSHGEGTGPRPRPRTKPTQCFLAGTQVLMADESTKNIEDVKVGDKVLATDPETGRTENRKVTALIVTEGHKHLNELTIRTKDGEKKLTATSEHPFWVPSERQWVSAGDLKPGMKLRTVDGTTAEVRANRAYSKHTRTYNLTVEALHTYYVLAGRTPVLVHNQCAKKAPSGPKVPPIPKEVKYHYTAIKRGNGIPQLDDEGVQKIFRGDKPTQRQWAGAKEWVVPSNLPGNELRILWNEDTGLVGWSANHYTTIQEFPKDYGN
ncbi:polymorphic toxin-type HINT domain-containing protein [Streptomyces sp. NBC_01520]|uniref:polymorphic toxin-type HINT domain-containing protein n=1 Tax=Streptomyces sp. NBC_01520 TaxID=2903892 RepID=UPI003865E6BF